MSIWHRDILISISTLVVKGFAGGINKEKIKLLITSDYQRYKLLLTFRYPIIYGNYV